MPNDIKTRFLQSLAQRCGTLTQLDGSYSLYIVAGGRAIVYIRYSKVHEGGRTFYGLRQSDLRRLEGLPALICFLNDDRPEPLIVPYSEYEDVLTTTEPASDGQYKVQVHECDGAHELYIAQAGRFNVEGSVGWQELEAVLEPHPNETTRPALSHPSVQALLGSIGHVKGYDVWIPLSDRMRLDWTLTERFPCRQSLPCAFDSLAHVVSEIDVLWVQPGSGEIRGLFEVEHSTSIYSGLLRLNDVHLFAPSMKRTFAVVADDVRRGLFVKQLSRPTFRTSGLSGLCTFLDYADVFSWHQRLARDGNAADSAVSPPSTLSQKEV